jgi:NAD(P)-dependent dehydrogenase (short-subunit alcohol dehydrogenase family)
LDVLINCAGVASCAPLELTTTEEFQQVFGVNVFGSAAVTRHFLPLLRASSPSSPSCGGVKTGFRRPRSPRIINMSSLVGRIAIPWASVYSASKHAVEALSDALRLELRPQGILVVVIEPGFVKTALPGSM